MKVLTWKEGWRREGGVRYEGVRKDGYKVRKRKGTREGSGCLWYIGVVASV